ncbi:hypothetical protein SFUMM280S_08505 [Streptomyces fumanus]
MCPKVVPVSSSVIRNDTVRPSACSWARDRSASRTPARSVTGLSGVFQRRKSGSSSPRSQVSAWASDSASQEHRRSPWPRGPGRSVGRGSLVWDMTLIETPVRLNEPPGAVRTPPPRTPAPGVTDPQSIPVVTETHRRRA